MGTGKSLLRQGSSVPGNSKFKFSEVLGSIRYVCVLGRAEVFEQILEQKARARAKRKASRAMLSCLDFPPKGMGNVEGILSIISSRGMIGSHLLLEIALWEQYRKWVGGRAWRQASRAQETSRREFGDGEEAGDLRSGQMWDL